MSWPGRRPPRRQRHLQRRHRQGRPQVDLQRPADDPTAEGVEDHGEEGKLLEQPQVGDVGHPELIEPGDLHAPREVRDDPPVMAESVVAGTNARRRRHSRLSVRIRRSTRLWLTAQPSRRSRAVRRR